MSLTVTWGVDYTKRRFSVNTEEAIRRIPQAVSLTTQRCGDVLWITLYGPDSEVRSALHNFGVANAVDRGR